MPALSYERAAASSGLTSATASSSTWRASTRPRRRNAESASPDAAGDPRLLEVIFSGRFRMWHFPGWGGPTRPTPTRTSLKGDHHLPEMPTAFKIGERTFQFAEGKGPVDHRHLSVEFDCAE
jgi:hypothetical protein